MNLELGGESREEERCLSDLSQWLESYRKKGIVALTLKTTSGDYRNHLDDPACRPCYSALKAGNRIELLYLRGIAQEPPLRFKEVLEDEAITKVMGWAGFDAFVLEYVWGIRVQNTFDLKIVAKLLEEKGPGLASVTVISLTEDSHSKKQFVLSDWNKEFHELSLEQRSSLRDEAADLMTAAEKLKVELEKNTTEHKLFSQCMEELPQIIHRQVEFVRAGGSFADSLRVSLEFHSPLCWKLDKAGYRPRDVFQRSHLLPPDYILPPLRLVEDEDDEDFFD